MAVARRMPARASTAGLRSGRCWTRATGTQHPSGRIAQKTAHHTETTCVMRCLKFVHFYFCSSCGASCPLSRMIGPPVPSIYSLVISTSPMLSSFGISYIISSMNSSIMARRARASGILLHRLFRDGFKCSLVKVQFHFVKGKQFLILL